MIFSDQVFSFSVVFIVVVDFEHFQFSPKITWSILTILCTKQPVGKVSFFSLRPIEKVDNGKKVKKG